MEVSSRGKMNIENQIILLTIVLLKTQHREL